MTTTFSSILEVRRFLLHRKAIWKEIIDHLGIFLDTDAAKARHGIACETEEMAVPQTVISNVITEIETDFLTEISKELGKINESKVIEHVEQQNESRAKTGFKRTSYKTARGKGKQASGG